VGTGAGGGVIFAWLSAAGVSTGAEVATTLLLFAEGVSPPIGATTIFRSRG
jgi:hypothetical protein